MTNPPSPAGEVKPDRVSKAAGSMAFGKEVVLDLEGVTIQEVREGMISVEIGTGTVYVCERERSGHGEFTRRDASVTRAGLICVALASFTSRLPHLRRTCPVLQRSCKFPRTHFVPSHQPSLALICSHSRSLRSQVRQDKGGGDREGWIWTVLGGGGGEDGAV